VTLFDGRFHALKLEQTISEFVNKNKPLKGELVIIQVGENAVSTKYINLKMKLCNKVGIPVKLHYIASELPDAAILNEIKVIVESASCVGCIIQMPLPRLSLNSALELIPITKDIDLLSSKSMDQFMSGNFEKVPPVVRAVQYFINEYDIELLEKSVTVIGYGQIVGKPLTYYLKSLGAKVTVLDNYKTGTPIDSDLVILSAGVPNLLNGQDLAPGSSVIDFGSSVLDGKTVGDLNMHSDLNHLVNISPSPGGMGPLVVRFLVMNYLEI
jgi:methylenetetrahydrofolate dehydrogenase (NADP+) / methenyltetrahydrofolate cyclohydrolase